MRQALISGLVGLILGTGGALAYSHYFGDGLELMKLRAKLALLQADLDKSNDEQRLLREQNKVESAQVDKLLANNQDVKGQAPVAPSTEGQPTPPPQQRRGGRMGGMLGMMRAGFDHQRDQKFLLLKARLNLTPEQEAALKTVFDDMAKKADAMAQDMQAGKRPDFAQMRDLASFSAVNQTLDSILTPDQKKAYTQAQADQQQSQAETVAAVEMNQVAPLLQLSDQQKDQVYSILYQQHANDQNVGWLAQGVAATGDATQTLQSSAKSREDALSKVLSPDQLEIYHEEMQSQAQMQRATVQRMTGAQ